MNTPEDIDRIVQEVIRRLVSSSTAKSTTALHLSERVITLATIENRLNGIQQIVVARQAVVTPSVRDELRQKKIQLVQQDVPSQAQAGRKLFFANLTGVGLTSVIRDTAYEFQTIQQETLDAAVRIMTNQLTVDSLGVIATDQPEWAVCLANRNPDTHAFVGHNVECVRRAKTLNFNLMAMKPSPLFASLLKSFLS